MSVAKTVLVTGDCVLDHDIYQGSRQTPGANQRLGTRVCEQPGGAWLLYRMLAAVAKPEPLPATAASQAPAPEPDFQVAFGLDEAAFGVLPDHLHSYVLWEPCPAVDGSKQQVWRTTRPLGYGNLAADATRFLPPTSPANDQAAHVLVLDDAGLGFRFGDAQAIWPAALRGEAANAVEWIVLKMTSPLGQGDLWRTLVSRPDLRDRLVAIVSINEIRRQEVRIVRGLSWERAALDLVRELESNPGLRHLLDCRQLLVPFRSEGAVVMERQDDGSRRYRLLYDSGYLEGQWGHDIKGRSFGYLSALTAAVARELALASDSPNFQRAVQAGLSAMRTLSQVGHGPVTADQPGLPLDALAREIRRPRFRYAMAEIPNSHDGQSPWNLIAGSQQRPEPLYGVAHSVALAGTKALANIPYARFGKLFTVDRDEIESLRTIERLVRDYLAHDPGKQPLSLAVFGQPGSGKSFSVKQIAASLLGKEPAILEFNLSQFRGPEELIGAFHQVRDAVLRGQMPFVFWDEFDSREYQWLQYLLAPMQDGHFHEGQTTHPIGKCVFVFAGGTSYDFAHFGPRSDDQEAWSRFRACKGPDFVSRLSGYLNVLGPNPRAIYDDNAAEWVDDPTDICFPVRRALFLRVLLNHFGDERLQIDRGVLSAFLEVSRLKHGARSMEKLLKLAMQQAGGTAIRRSDLPSAALMDLYVDSQEFLEIINRNLPVQSHADRLAPAMHAFYTSLAVQTFHREHGREPADHELKHPRDFERLTAQFKDANRAAAARIPLVLELAGLYVVPNQDHQSADPDVQAAIAQNLELLASTEHELWLDYMQCNGWRHAAELNENARFHNLLVPYDQLSESDKDKDRSQVANYPSILAQAGYRIATWSQLQNLQNGNAK